MKRALSIYIHIPFCVKKCAYCDFLSAPASPEIQEQYLHMLMQEIRQKAAIYADKYIVKTIFIGGGTPTTVSAELLCCMIEELYRQFSVDKAGEISIECNPGTVDACKLIQYRKAGINRLSIGLQSTLDRLLRILGRIHNYEQFLETFKEARKAGFDNINIDLMSGLPGQSLADYRNTLQQVLGLQPEHISAYSLIVEEGTPFYDMELELPDEDTERAMYELTEQMLHRNGYARYEISNYAKPGFESRHNSVYWERGEYLGIGLGASSLIRRENPSVQLPVGLTDEQRTPYLQEVRLKNITILEKYLAGDFGVEEEVILSKREAMEEFFFLGLRQMKGVSLAEFAEWFGEDTIDLFTDAIAKSVRDGLLCQEGSRLFLTRKGIDVSNVVFERFLE